MDTKLIDAVKELKFTNLLTITYFFLGTLAPGFLIIYLYKPELITELETAKLCIFCFSLTIPALLINCTLSIVVMSPQMNNLSDESLEKKGYLIFVLGSAITFFILYPALAAAYFKGWNFKTFIVAVTIAEAVVMAIIKTAETLNTKKKTKQ